MFDKLTTLGRKRFALPFAAVLAIGALFGFIVYPMLVAPVAPGAGAPGAELPPVPGPLPLGGSAVMVTVMLTFMLSVFPSIVIHLITRAEPTAPRPQRIQLAVTRVLLAAAASALGASVVVLVVGGIAGIAIPAGTVYPFLWLASFTLICAFTGLLALRTWAGGIAIVGCLACGMATGNLPYEMLPSFWQNWLHPWVPQASMADGVRQIYHFGAGPANSAATYFLVVVALALAVHCAAVVVPSRLRARA
ncbi:MAG: hypothetical protein FWD59_07310 [Micrococcales bacterium]|nr:hypothetical protein [Micrococcales bacterium]